MEKKKFEEDMLGEGSESLINSAFLDARRRSFLQSSIVYYMGSPLLFEEEQNCYHYELALQSMCGLLIEISPKLSTDELDEMISMRKELQEFVDTKQIWQRRFDTALGRYEGKLLNRVNWKELREGLFEFSLKLKRLGDTHGFGSPDKDDPRAAVISD